MPRKRLIWAGALILVTVISGCTATGAGKPTETTAPKPPATANSLRVAESLATRGVTETKVIKFTPAPPNGEEREGSCWTHSIGDRRPEAWRCMVGNQIYDPCFASYSGVIVCGANPRTKEAGFKLKLSQPLPTDKRPATTGDNWAWLLELDDGTVCSFATGATGVIDGKRLNYSCNADGSDYVMILGDLRIGTVWTAEKVIVASGASGPTVKQSESVPVRAVWQ